MNKIFCFFFTLVIPSEWFIDLNVDGKSRTTSGYVKLNISFPRLTLARGRTIPFLRHQGRFLLAKSKTTLVSYANYVIQRNQWRFVARAHFTWNIPNLFVTKANIMRKETFEDPSQYEKWKHVQIAGFKSSRIDEKSTYCSAWFQTWKNDYSIITYNTR